MRTSRTSTCSRFSLFSLAHLVLLVAGVVLSAVRPAEAQNRDVEPPMSDAEALRLVEQMQEQIINTVAKVSPAYVRIGGGSGILISPDGYMVTNHHVAADQHFNVTIGTGKAYRAVNIGQDQRGDICLLKLETTEPLPYVEIGDSDTVRVGDTVLTLGNPFLYAFDDAKPTVTQGVVSALNRYQQGYADCFMIDARVNPGNSGGPLLTLDGKWIGINGRIAVRAGFGTRINTGIGFAIPSNQIMRFVHAWRKQGGELRHGIIDGLDIGSGPNGDIAQVTGVAAGKDAATAGFQLGDRIIRIDGRPVTTRNRFWGIIGTYPAGSDIRVEVLRGSQAVTLRVVLAPTDTRDQGRLYPEPPRTPFVKPELPWILPAPLLRPTPKPNPNPKPDQTPTQGAYLGVTIDLDLDPNVKGAPVARVLDDTPAARSKLLPKDVIVAIDDKTIDSFGDLRDFLTTKAAGDIVELKYQRKSWGFTRTYTVKVVLYPPPKR